MGDVHLARPVDPNRGIPAPVVVKRLHNDLAANPTFVQRFRHEAEIAVSVDSEHVAKVFDVGSVGEALYIAMEFVDGWPLTRFLETVIESRRHASIASIADLFAGGLRGLHALHTAVDRDGQPLGIVHRDISPKNLMVGDDGKMRIIDLGLGKSNQQEWKTRTGVVMGSVGYMPPEQVAGKRVDARADVYAMGVCLYEALSLRSFIKRGPLPTMLHASVKPKLTPPSEHRTDVPRALDDVVLKALQPELTTRYQTAGEFLEALEAVIPARRARGGMASLIGELFGESLIDRQEEIAQLMHLALPDAGPEIERTVVFVQRSGVQPIVEADVVDPTRLQPRDAPTLAPTAVQTAPGRRPRPSQDAVRTKRASTSVPPPAQKAGVPMWVLAVAMAATLAIGLLLGGMFSSPPDNAIQLAPAATARPGPAAVGGKPGAIGAVAAPKPADDPVQPPPVEPPAPEIDPPKPNTGRRRPAPAVTTPSSVVEAPPASVASNTELAKTLLARAKALKGRLDPGSADAQQVDAIRAKISMELGRSDLAGAAKRIEALGRDLATIERAN